MFQRFTHSIASCPFQTGDSFPRWTCNLGSFYCHDCNWSPKSRGLREWWGHLFGGHWKLCLRLSLFGRTWFCLLPNYRCVFGGCRTNCKVSHPNLGKHHSFWWVISELYWIHKFSHEWLTISFLGSYADWTSDVANAGHANFCPETPFMFSFVWLIIVWSLIPLACCLAACGLAGWENWRKVTIKNLEVRAMRCSRLKINYILIWLPIRFTCQSCNIFWFKKTNSNEKCDSCLRPTACIFFA